MNILNGSKLSTESDVLQGGALVFYILRYKFQSALVKLKPSVCSADDLAFVIMNSSGYKGHVQFTYELFEDLIKQQIDVFEETCINFA